MKVFFEKRAPERVEITPTHALHSVKAPLALKGKRVVEAKANTLRSSRKAAQAVIYSGYHGDLFPTFKAFYFPDFLHWGK